MPEEIFVAPKRTEFPLLWRSLVIVRLFPVPYRSSRHNCSRVTNIGASRASEGAHARSPRARRNAICLTRNVAAFSAVATSGSGSARVLHRIFMRINPPIKNNASRCTAATDASRGGETSSCDAEGIQFSGDPAKCYYPLNIVFLYNGHLSWERGLSPRKDNMSNPIHCRSLGSSTFIMQTK